jgi:hypothetical protein
MNKKMVTFLFTFFGILYALVSSIGLIPYYIRN